MALMWWWAGLVVASYAPVEGVQWSCAEGTGRGRVDVVVGAGALHEGEDARGVAHLLEHLLLRKGNFSFRHENAWTSLDFTHYLRTAPSASLPDAAAALLSELAEPTFGTEDVAIERKVVVKELEERGVDHGRGTDPLFGGTILARSTGGSSRDVRGLRLEDVMRFHRRFYGRGNVAIRVTDAANCEQMRATLTPILKTWPEGPAADVPRVDAPEPGPVTLPSPHFQQGFYWYDAGPRARLLWIAVGEHLRLAALRELRQERGLIYTPRLRVQWIGPGGLVSLSVDAGDHAREVAQWFDQTVTTLTSEPRVTAHLSEALTRVGQWLDEHPEATALAAIRGEPDPRGVLERLRSDVPQEELRRMLVDRRRFGSKLPQSNVLSLIILGAFGIGVLAVLLYAGRQFLQD